MTVITVGSKYEVYVRSPASSHIQPLKQHLSNPCNKVRGKILLKKSFCVFILPASFITVSVIIASACIQYIYAYFCMNQKMYMYTTIVLHSQEVLAVLSTPLSVQVLYTGLVMGLFTHVACLGQHSSFSRSSTGLNSEFSFS